MRQSLIILTASLMFFSCAPSDKLGFYRGYETSSYKVVEQNGDIEIRQYPAILVAEVEVEGDRKKAVKKGFIILARYIFGKNISQEKVAMTSPVLQENISEKIAMTSPVTQISDSQKTWRIQFAMPKQYTLESLPKALDEKIKFKITKEKTLVAIRFSGSWSDKLFEEKKLMLKNFIEQKNLSTTSAAAIFYYDDPLTFPWNRRNEIIQEIK